MTLFTMGYIKKLKPHNDINSMIPSFPHRKSKIQISCRFPYSCIPSVCGCWRRTTVWRLRACFISSGPCLVAVDNVVLLMTVVIAVGEQWGGWLGGGLFVAELVKERLNMHLSSPEVLIKERRCQVPAFRRAQWKPHCTRCSLHTHTRLWWETLLFHPFTHISVPAFWISVHHSWGNALYVHCSVNGSSNLEPKPWTLLPLAILNRSLKCILIGQERWKRRMCVWLVRGPARGLPVGNCIDWCSRSKRLLWIVWILEEDELTHNSRHIPTPVAICIYLHALRLIRV